MKKKLLITGLIIGVVIIIIFLFLNKKNRNSDFEDPFEEVNNLIWSTTTTSEYEDIEFLHEVLYQDFSEERIDADKYIMQLAYSIYDVDKLDYTYKDLELGILHPTGLLKKASELADIISVDTAKYVLEKYMLSDVEWHVEDDTNSSTIGSDQQNDDYEVIPLISESDDLSKLSKAVLSSEGNFIIYYTTNGVNAITTEQAKEIAKTLEKIVAFYENNYGLKFKYDPNLQEGTWGMLNEVLSFGKIPQATTKAKKVLTKSNIDTKYLDTAMPVFIIDTDVENTNVLGYYVDASPASILNGFSKLVLKVNDLWTDYDAKWDNMLTAYAFPYFVVNSNSFGNDVKIILAHELFHHYQKYICGEGEYGECMSGNFTVETMAHYAASEFMKTNKIFDEDNVLNGHAGNYVKYFVSESLEHLGASKERLGYPAFVFAYNYGEIVPNGTMKLFNSSKYEDSLKFLYDNSEGKYKEVFITLAKKNMVQDYDNQYLLSKCNKKACYPKNHKKLDHTDKKYEFEINYSSMQYFYINPSSYKEFSQITFTGSSDDLSLLLFAKEDNKYKYLYTHDLNSEFIINVSDFKYYDEVVFGIVNSGIVDNINYSIEIKENGTEKTSVSKESLGLVDLGEVIKNSSNVSCYQIEDDGGETLTIMQIKLLIDKNSKINGIYYKGTVRVKDINNIINKIAFELATRLISQMFKEYNNDASLKETKSSDEYSLLGKIESNYYEFLDGEFDVSNQDILSIVNAIQAKNYVCKYSK